ncbi:MAG: hypothetical protein NC048_09880 [Bacteroides sp.]|nr:hypothetical protein [Bacteroides sp.]MCM1555782.1 hypothetical protein [Bacteroides sp.]
MESWEKTKDGLMMVMTKGNLTVNWDLVAHRYTVSRTDRDGMAEIVEKGRTPHLPVDMFLHYIELTWA